VHELDALLGGRAEDGLILVDLDLDADRLEPDDVLLTQLDLQAAPGRAGSGREKAGEYRPSPFA
jgi:hypothetical protein